MESILHAFGISAPVTQTELLSGGRIHRSFRVTTTAGDYIVQQFNSRVFRRPAQVMANIDTVTAYLRTQFPTETTLHFYRTAAGDFLHDGYRVMDYIPGVTLTAGDAPAVSRAAGAAFGHFVDLLASLNAAQLSVTIPGFHDTPARYAALEAAIRANPLDRAKHAVPLMQRLCDLREAACALCRSDLPRRIVHNDTKLANLRFDAQTRRPVAVLDLDTVMPGLAAYDFGDMVRSLCGAALDMAVYHACLEGYLAGAACLNKAERASLPKGVLCITTELSVRYLTDYLTGDAYFQHPDSLRRASELADFAWESRGL